MREGDERRKASKESTNGTRVNVFRPENQSFTPLLLFLLLLLLLLLRSSPLLPFLRLLGLRSLSGGPQWPRFRDTHRGRLSEAAGGPPVGGPRGSASWGGPPVGGCRGSACRRLQGVRLSEAPGGPRCLEAVCRRLQGVRQLGVPAEGLPAGGRKEPIAGGGLQRAPADTPETFPENQIQKLIQFFYCPKQYVKKLDGFLD